MKRRTLVTAWPAWRGAGAAQRMWQQLVELEQRRRDEQRCGDRAPKPTQSVEVMLDWVPNPDHLGLYTTLAKGYFKAQGLDVKLQPPSNVTDVAKLVATGNVPIGISYEPDTIIAGASNLPITPSVRSCLSR